MVRIDILGLKGVVLHGAEANKYVLVDGVDNLLVAPLIDRVHARWIVGEGLLFIDDPRHKRERRRPGVVGSLHDLGCDGPSYCTCRPIPVYQEGAA